MLSRLGRNTLLANVLKMADAISLPAWAVDRRGRIIAASAAAHSLMPRGADLRRVRVPDVIPGAERWSIPLITEQAVQLEIPHPEGPRSAELRTVPLEGAGSARWLVLLVDRGLQRSLENRQRELEHAVMAGRLAAGLAHRMNTPLASIVFDLEELATTTTSEKVRTLCERVLGQVAYCQRLQRGLLDFARITSSEPRKLDVAAEVRDICAFFEAVSRRGGGQLLLELPEEGTATILADPVVLRSLLAAVLENAFDAAGAEGTVKVSVHRYQNRCAITVTDDGPGMTPDVLARAFEPFFTTKPAGQGTGLGLAIAFRTARDLGGELRITSAPGRGCRCLIELPLADPESMA